MVNVDQFLEPDWDEDNVRHIGLHGIRSEQVEEVYCGESPFPTFALKNLKDRSNTIEYRYRLWGTDASRFCIEAIVVPYPKYDLRRCVTALPMSDFTQKAYFKRIKK